MIHAPHPDTQPDQGRAFPAPRRHAGGRVRGGALLTALVIAGGLCLLAVTWFTAHRRPLQPSVEPPFPAPVTTSTTQIQSGDTLHQAAYAPPSPASSLKP